MIFQFSPNFPSFFCLQYFQKDINLLIVYSSANEPYSISIFFSPLLCALGPFPAAMLFMHGWPAIPFSCAQQTRSKGSVVHR